MRALRLCVVLLCLLLPLAPVAGGWRAHGMRPFELGDAPRVLAGMVRAGDSRLEERVLQEIAPSAYLMRSFSDGTTDALAYVAFYTGFDSSGAHDPQVCYPAQGFDIGEIRNVAVPLGDGGQLWSKVFRARQGAYEEVVLHWFQPLDRWPADPRLEPWVRMLQAFRGKKAYAFVRISVEIGTGGAAAAEQRAIAMAAELAPWSRAVLSRADSVGEEPPQPRTQEAGHGHGQARPDPGDALQPRAARIRG
jgi:EpsI family protein